MPHPGPWRPISRVNGFRTEGHCATWCTKLAPERLGHLTVRPPLISTATLPQPRRTTPSAARHRRRACYKGRRVAEIAAFGRILGLCRLPNDRRNGLYISNLCRVSTAVVQRFCKPKVGGSNPSPGMPGGAKHRAAAATLADRDSGQGLAGAVHPAGRRYQCCFRDDTKRRRPNLAQALARPRNASRQSRPTSLRVPPLTFRFDALLWHIAEYRALSLGDVWREAIVVLKAREMQIVMERRCCDKRTTLDVLAQRYGVSRERVRQIEVRVLNKLRKAMNSDTGGRSSFRRLPDQPRIAQSSMRTSEGLPETWLAEPPAFCIRCQCGLWVELKI